MVYIPEPNIIRVWGVEDSSGNETSEGLYEDYQEAIKTAQNINGAVVEYTYKLQDSKVIKEFWLRCQNCGVQITDDDDAGKELYCGDCYES